MKSAKEALNYGTKLLSSRLDAELLLRFVLGISIEKILLNPEFRIKNHEWEKYKKLIKKRKQGYPIAYLTGHKEFYGIDFFVNENVLVPRPETELLVEEILSYESRIKNHELRILEIGTGSGCIALTLAKYLPKAKTIAVDISEKALSVARKNFKRIKQDNKTARNHVQFRKSNLLSNIKSLPDIIVANLPYLTRDELKEPSIAKEPRLALCGGKDGLELYEKLFQQIGDRLCRGEPLCSPKPGQPRRAAPTGKPTPAIFIEIGEKQGKRATQLAKKYFPKSKIEVKKDLARRDRVVIIKI